MTAFDYDEQLNKSYHKENELDLLKWIQKIVDRYNKDLNHYYCLRVKVQRRRFALW